ncbi:QWxxN domain [Enterococcus mundtii]|uniref:QWxxN domain n=1 Tax=Enterococcus mundtii TaxID=53346 RepID=UPI001EDF8F36|nr:QWxxN domain [Enterococcus mundtii]
MPIEEHRKAVGTFENKRNKNSDQNARQESVNFISSTANNQLTERIRWSPLLFFQLLVITDSLAVRGEPLRPLRASRPAFEADTTVEIGPLETNANKTTIHSLFFRSSVNTTLVQPAQPINASEYLSDPVKNATLQEPISLAEFTHHWTLQVHKTIHNLEKIDKCNTTVTPMSVLEYGLWEKKNHTLYHFNTICEEAKSKSLQLREQAKDDQQEIQHFSFKNKDSRNKVDLGKIQRESKNIARMVLSSYYDHEAEPSSSHSENNHTRPFLPTSFWDNLTDTFTSFFHEYQNSSHTTGSGEPPVESVLSTFFTVLARTFSAEHLATEHAQKESRRGTGAAYFPQVLMSEQPQSSMRHQDQAPKNDQATEAPILEEEEEYLAAPLLELAKKFNERIDQFFEKSNFQIFPGAEALPIPKKNPTDHFLPYASSTSVLMNYMEEEPSVELKATVNEVLKRYVNIEPSLSITVKQLTPFWFHLVLFQKRYKVDAVMNTLRKSLCELSDAVCFSNSISTKELFRGLQEWGTSKDPSDYEQVLERRQKIAKLILEAYDVKVDGITDIEAVKIFLQARNNHAFKYYTFHEPKSLDTANQQTISSSSLPDVRPYDASQTPLNSAVAISALTRAFFDQTMDAYMKDQPLPIPPKEPINAMWFDLDVYQQRTKTEIATNKMKENVCEYLGLCLIDDLSTKDFFLTLQKWGSKGMSSTSILEKRLQIAHLILQSYGLKDEVISDERAIAIFIQWLHNDALKHVPFTEQHLIDLHPIQSVHLEHKKLLPYDISAQVSLKSTRELSEEEQSVVNKIVMAHLKNQPLPDNSSVPLPPIWFDSELFDKREETEKVNGLIIRELSSQYVELNQLSELAPNDFSLVLQNFASRGRSDAVIIARRLQIAKTILDKHGLPAHNLSEKRAIAIFMQWRYNNAFRGYNFKEEREKHFIQKRTGGRSDNPYPGTSLYETAQSLQAPLFSYEELHIDVEHKLKLWTISYLDTRYLYNTLIPHVILMPFWYHSIIFEERSQTETINGAVKDYLAHEEGDFRQLNDSVIRYTFIELASLESEESPDQSLIRRRKIAHVILDTLRRPATKLTDAEVNAIFLQWRTNNVFIAANFKNIKTIPLLESPQVDEIATTDQTVNPSLSSQEKDLIQIKRIVQEISNNRQPSEADRQNIPNCYFVFSIYQNIYRTHVVKEKIRKYLRQQNIVGELDTSEKLINEVDKWVGEEWEVENSVDAGKMQFLTYMILEEYRVEFMRFGEVLSTRKMQAIYMQWKMNTLLEGGTYKDTDEQTIYYKLSPPESPYVISNFQHKQDSDQIYRAFSRGYNSELSTEKPIIPYVYYKNIFDKQEETYSVNPGVRNYLLTQKVPTIPQETEGLTKALEDWILSEPNYYHMVERVKKAAKIILQEYNVNEEDLTLNKAYAVILQWVNNNAQFDFTFDMQKICFAYGTEEASKNQEILEKAKAFISENNIEQSTETIGQAEIDTFGRSAIQVEATFKKIADFLTSEGYPCDTDDTDNLVRVASYWTLKEGTAEEILDFGKIKKLVVMILGARQAQRLSNNELQQAFVKWAVETLEMAAPPTITSAPVITPAPAPIDQSFGTREDREWRDLSIRKQIESFFQDKKLLPDKAAKEDILIAFAKWFSQDGAGITLMPDKTQEIAKVILRAMNRYGGETSEVISHKNAELTVTKWIFENILGCSIEAYVAKNILASSNPSVFTIGQLRKLFEIDEMLKTGTISFGQLRTANATEESLILLKKMWILLVQKTLPNYFLETSQLADELLISEFGSLVQLVGSKLLDNEGYISQFNQTEIRKLGAAFCETISVQGISTLDELNHVLIAALIATAQFDPEGLREAGKTGDYKGYALKVFLGYWQKRHELSLQLQEEVQKRFLTFQAAMINWRRKQVITEEVVQECVRLGAQSTFGIGETYLGGGSPCPSLYTPVNIEVAYTSLTKQVSETYFSFDQKIIEFSFNTMNLVEYDFIFSPTTQIYGATAQLKNKVHYYAPSGPGVMPPVFFARRETWLDTTLSLDQTDLFVAINGTEERLYALKKLPDEGGYIIYRVDKKPLLYLNFGLFNNKKVWGQGYQAEGDKIRIGDKLFTFTVEINKEKKLSQGIDNQPLIDYFAHLHKDILYKLLYDFGNDKTIKEKVWNIVKHFIPFYDCVVGIIDQNVGEAATSCAIDAIFLIPFLGQVTSVTSKFALGTAKAMATGGMKSVIKNAPHFLPTITDVKFLLKSSARYVDPGFELLMGGGKIAIKRLINLQYTHLITEEMKLLLKKLEKYQGAKMAKSMEKDMVLAKLTKDGPYIFVKRKKGHLYLQVTNIETGDVFGRYYTLNGDQLKVFEGPIPSTPEQIELVKRLTSSVVVYKSFGEEKNLNPKGYGEGTILTITKVDQPIEYYIKINAQTVPVRVTTIDGQGTRYDVCEGNKVFPVMYNGIEWGFEPPSSQTVTKELIESLEKQLDQSETLKDPTTLSPPDENGLMWNAQKNAYIKIKDQYVPIQLLDAEESRYSIVKKNANAPMTVLRFEPEMNQFRFETPEEKKMIDLKNAILTAGKRKKYEEKVIPSTSKDASSSSQAEGPPKKTPQYIEYNTLPPKAGMEKEWNALRDTVPYADSIARTIDLSIKLEPLTAFIPELPNRVLTNQEERLVNELTGGINLLLPKKPALLYRVFTGLDPTTFPNFLQPFINKFNEEVEKSSAVFQTFIEKADEWLSHDNIADTEAAKLLIPFFELQGVANREAIMRATLNRLKSVCEKGNQFIQQSSAFGFNNILTVSTNLVYQKKTKKYLSRYSTPPQANAFVLRYDPEARIIILADSFHVNPALAEGKDTESMVKQTLIHEITHLVSLTDDWLAFDLPDIGEDMLSLKQVLDEYKEDAANLIVSKPFNDFVDQISKQLNLPGLSPESVREALKTDPFLQANIKMTDAETVTILLISLAEGLPFEKAKLNKRDIANSQLGSGYLMLAIALSSILNYTAHKKEIQLEQTQTIENNKTTTSAPVSEEHPREKRGINTIITYGKTASTITNTQGAITKQKMEKNFYNPFRLYKKNQKEQYPYDPSKSGKNKSMKRSDLNLSQR